MKALFFLLLPAFALGQAKGKTNMPALATSSEITKANILTLPSREGKIFYEYIDSSFKKSKDNVYNDAKIWFADAFKDSRNVIQVADKEAGELLGKGNFSYRSTIKGVSFENTCQFTLRVTCRENKYRIQIYDLKHRLGDGTFVSLDAANGKDSDLFQPILNRVDIEITNIIDDSKKAITKKADNF